MLLAFAVGFVLGGRGGSRGRHDVVDAFGTIRDSAEVAALVMVARSGAAKTLRHVAELVDGSGRQADAPPDLVDRVRQMVGR